MLTQIMIGFLWTCLTVGISVGFIIALDKMLDPTIHFFQKTNPILRDWTLLMISVSWMMLGIVVIVFVWASLFWVLGIFETLEAANYFSFISITTLGFGDILLPDPWRLLSGFVAADGFIIFGLYTAALFDILSRLRAINKIKSEPRPH
ncbi:MAG: ion channel [Pseudomonadota bacterium]